MTLENQILTARLALQQVYHCPIHVLRYRLVNSGLSVNISLPLSYLRIVDNALLLDIEIEQIIEDNQHAYITIRLQ